MRRRRTSFGLSALVLLAALASPSEKAQGSAAQDTRDILDFRTMIGVRRPLTGAANAIRGVPGGGLPWVIANGRGELRTNGEIKIEVEGLVLDPADPAVIERGLAGVNPSPSFKAIVSCLSVDGNGNLVTLNIETGLSPASMSGDAEIRGKVDLPDPCILPIVFVASPAGAWFAATGF